MTYDQALKNTCKSLVVALGHCEIWRRSNKGRTQFLDLCADVLHRCATVALEQSCHNQWHRHDWHGRANILFQSLAEKMDEICGLRRSSREFTKRYWPAESYAGNAEPGFKPSESTPDISQRKLHAFRRRSPKATRSGPAGSHKNTVLDNAIIVQRNRDKHNVRTIGTPALHDVAEDA